MERQEIITTRAQELFIKGTPLADLPAKLVNDFGITDVEAQTVVANALKNLETESCPICGGTIKKGAKKCIHCDEWFGGSGFEGKTLWDWMNLLIVPVVLAIGGFLLANYQDQRQDMIEDRRIVAQRVIETDRAQESALQNYFDGMAILLLEKKLRASGPTDEIRSIARSRTLTVLRRLDSERKGALLQFLYESGLVTQTRIINLSRADLSGADLGRANLKEVNLSGATLITATLSGADLSGSNLSGATLITATLNGADLSGSNLSEAILWVANLSYANLNGADLRGAKLSGANLRQADLRGADLRGANLGPASPRVHHPGIGPESTSPNPNRINRENDAYLRGAKYSADTKWPIRFDPKEAGAIEE